MKTLYRYFIGIIFVYLLIKCIPQRPNFNYECMSKLSEECKNEVRSASPEQVKRKTCTYHQSAVCHIVRYLRQDSKSTCYEKTLLNATKQLNQILTSRADQIEYKWLKDRYSQIKSQWKDYSPISEMHVIVYMGLLDPKSHMNIREGLYSGGPLGEMIQWSSILAALDSFTTKLELATSLVELDVTKSKCMNETATLKADIILTDIIGAKLLKSTSSTFYDNIKCRLRILDSFGTDAFFNHPSMAESSGYKNPWGRLDLNLKQFWTFYPQQGNSFIGFTTNGTVNRIDKKENVAVIYGKKRQYFQGHENFLNELSQMFQVHTTITDDEDFAVVNGFHNHPHLTPSNFNHLLSEAKVFVGLGFPYEGPSPVEALQNGAYFLNAQLEPPVGRSETAKTDYVKDFFNDKPTFRRLDYQVPFLATINSTYIINAPLQMTDKLRSKLLMIKAQTEFEGQEMTDFSPDRLLSRVKKLLNINYCLPLPTV